MKKNQKPHIEYLTDEEECAKYTPYAYSIIVLCILATIYLEFFG